MLCIRKEPTSSKLCDMSVKSSSISVRIFEFVLPDADLSFLNVSVRWLGYLPILFEPISQTIFLAFSKVQKYCNCKVTFDFWVVWSVMADQPIGIKTFTLFDKKGANSAKSSCKRRWLSESNNWYTWIKLRLIQVSETRQWSHVVKQRVCRDKVAVCINSKSQRTNKENKV